MGHARVAEEGDAGDTTLVERLLCHQYRSYALCYNLYRPDHPWEDRPEQSRDRIASALYYVAFGGLSKTVAMLLKRGADVNTHSKQLQQQAMSRL
jgi:hypothetical protein